MKTYQKKTLANDHGLFFHIPVDTPLEVSKHLKTTDFSIFFNDADSYYWLFTEKIDNYWIDFYSIENEYNHFRITYFERTV